MLVSPCKAEAAMPGTEEKIFIQCEQERPPSHPERRHREQLGQQAATGSLKADSDFFEFSTLRATHKLPAGI